MLTMKQKKKEISTKSHEGPRRDTKRDGSAASTGLWPGNPAGAPSRSKSDGRRPPRERGRPARMQSRCVPLSFPAMPQPTPCRRERHGLGPMQSPGAVAGRAGWWRLPRLCQDTCAGGTLALPGGLHPVTLRYQGHDHRRSRLPVQQPIVLTILCILCIDVQLIVLPDGSAQSRRARASRPHPCPSDSS